jgi:uroporphyrinogen III methyltransferase/synthase
MTEPAAPNPPQALPPPPAPAAVKSLRGRWLWLALAVLAAAGAWGFRALDRDNIELRERVAQLAVYATPAIEQARQATQEAQRQVADLKQTVADMQADRASLERLVGDVLRMRDDATMIDVERLITLAAAELRISGHVPTSLAALEAADARLAAIDRPQYATLRRALARDIERLRAAPQVDTTGIALRLDEFVQAVDSWPLLADARPARPAAVKPAPVPADDAWGQVRAWVMREFGDLIRIREVDTPEALLLSSSQQQLARERLKLRLLSARQALLARNDRLFRSDLAETQAALVRYFDSRAAGPAAALAQLKQLAQMKVTVDVPTVAESLTALRAVRARPLTTQAPATAVKAK